MSSYNNTTSYNSLPDGSGGATSFFVLSVLVINWQKPSMMIKKKRFYHHMLIGRPCYFQYNMDMLIFHTWSNQKPFYTKENHWQFTLKLHSSENLVFSRHYKSKSWMTTTTSTHQSMVENKHLNSNLDY